LTENVEGWKYGNIRLIADLIGDKIDLLKDNMKRLVLSNVAKGDDGTLKKSLKYSLNSVSIFILHQSRNLTN